METDAVLDTKLFDGLTAELPTELRERLQRIMASKPAHVCGAHWLLICEGSDRVTVKPGPCACTSLSIPERKLIRQLELELGFALDCSASDIYGEPSNADVEGIDDRKALAALRARAIICQTREKVRW